MSLVKYRLKELATDFGVAPKEIVEVLSKYFEKPKSNTQILTEEELNVVFDYITQKNQIASLEQVFAVPGMGSLLISSIGNQDYPVVQAIIVIIAVVVVLCNFLADLLYRVMDPRLKDR